MKRVLIYSLFFSFNFFYNVNSELFTRDLVCNLDYICKTYKIVEYTCKNLVVDT